MGIYECENYKMSLMLNIIIGQAMEMKSSPDHLGFIV